MDDRIREAVEAGMVLLDERAKTATILAPHDPFDLSDDDWLAVLSAATEVGHKLEQMGYTVKY